MGSNPHCGDHFSRAIHSFGSKHGSKIFEKGWLIKSNFITKDEMKACQLTRAKFPQKIKVNISCETIHRPKLMSISMERINPKCKNFKNGLDDLYSHLKKKKRK
jgi:hypothetical protein